LVKALSGFPQDRLLPQGLGVLEGDSVRAQLMKLYDTKSERTLIGRGILREKPALEEVFGR
jgi:hypothetical protein